MQDGTGNKLADLIKETLGKGMRDASKFDGVLPPKELRKMFRTLDLGLPRGSGKSSAIVQLARPGDIVLVPSEVHKRNLVGMGLRNVEIRVLKDYQHPVKEK